MAHFARQAAEQSHDVLMVVGLEHVESITKLIEEADDVSELLHGDAASGEQQATPEDEAWRQELEKRTALAVFLRVTRTLNPEIVLPDREGLIPEAAELAAKYWPKY